MKQILQYLSQVDLSYRQIYTEPIGRELFCEFCSSDSFADGELSRLDSFLRAIVSRSC